MLVQKLHRWMFLDTNKTKLRPKKNKNKFKKLPIHVAAAWPQLQPWPSASSVAILGLTKITKPTPTQLRLGNQAKTIDTVNLKNL